MNYFEGVCQNHSPWLTFNSTHHFIRHMAEYPECNVLHYNHGSNVSNFRRRKSKILQKSETGDLQEEG